MCWHWGMNEVRLDRAHDYLSSTDFSIHLLHVIVQNRRKQYSKLSFETAAICVACLFLYLNFTIACSQND